MRLAIVAVLLVGCGAAAARPADPPRADADGDGVVRDRCEDIGGNHQAEGTPEGCPESGAIGSETDPDGDGVQGAADDCPTLPGPGTSNGCPRRSSP